MREFFDVALIGGGPAAVFAAYEFSLKYPELKVVILEEGHPIEQRKCPLFVLLCHANLKVGAVFSIMRQLKHVRSG